MRLFKRFALLLFILLLLFVGHTLRSTGFFRTVDNTFDGTILKKVAVRGAEDIMISEQDSFALISSTDRANRSTAEEGGSLFLIDLRTSAYEPIPLTISSPQAFAPHGISFFKKDSIYHVMAINHTKQGHSIECFELQDQTLTHIRTLRHPSMIQPNDLVMLDDNRFYFTNDHGYTEGFKKLVEEYGGLALANVVYFDGQQYREVADGIAYPNGINIDRERNLLYVASSRGFLVKVYAQEEDGSLSFIEDIPCETGVDNIEFDNEGNLWIGSHPSLLRFSAYAGGKEDTSPSEIIKITYRDKGDYSIEQIYVEEGLEMSGSSVAAVFGDLIFAGNVMDDEFLILKTK